MNLVFEILNRTIAFTWVVVTIKSNDLDSSVEATVLRTIGCLLAAIFWVLADHQKRQREHTLQPKAREE